MWGKVAIVAAVAVAGFFAFKATRSAAPPPMAPPTKPAPDRAPLKPNPGARWSSTIAATDTALAGFFSGLAGRVNDRLASSSGA